MEVYLTLYILPPASEALGHSYLSKFCFYLWSLLWSLMLKILPYYNRFCMFPNSVWFPAVLASNINYISLSLSLFFSQKDRELGSGVD